MNPSTSEARQTRISVARSAVAALVLALGIGAWLIRLHDAIGGNERHSLPFLLHLLRDTGLAAPFVVAAVLLAREAGARAFEAAGGRTARGALMVEIGASAVGASIAFAFVSPLQSLLFLSSQPRPTSLPVAAGRDGLVVLALAIPLAAVVSLLERVRIDLSAFNSRRTLIPAAVTFAIVAAAFTVGVGSAASGASPCPSGAPVKHFDVTALNVDIPLNRFGDHDPLGKMYVLNNRIDDVRQQEQDRKVSIGLQGGDAIQPLVIRANEGDCVEMTLTNSAGDDYGAHIDGLQFSTDSSGDAVGDNLGSAVPNGGSTTYRYFVPEDPRLEGAHYIHPGPGNREATAHGLFGSLVVEPPGSTYLDPNGPGEVTSGWEAIIKPGSNVSFREYALLFHEIGDESFDVVNAKGEQMPKIDPFTGAYRPGSRAMNYRSEPFIDRLKVNPDQESQAYGSYAFADPATPTPRGYLGDPTKMRIIHAGTEMFHVFHLHGGGIRWRFDPLTDHTFSYGDTGLNKKPKTEQSPSTRLDSQAFGPGESYNLEIEGGAGGVQQAAGDFLFHCHIASHYVSGMWAFWRVYNTTQPGFRPLPDRSAPPAAVDSVGLLGRKMPDGTVLTTKNLDGWIRAQLPPSGVPKSDQDASVWNWTVDESNKKAPLYLGEPEDTSDWPDLPHLVQGDAATFPGDRVVNTRTVIMFDPLNGRPAYPLLRPHIGHRPPFSPNGHSGAPYLGENADQKTSNGVLAPWTGRPDGLCPAGATIRRFNIVALDGLNNAVTTAAGGVDPNGKVFVLAQDKDDVLAGRKPIQPLAIRANVGDCAAVTLTSQEHDANSTGNFSKVNIHIHHVQFDVQASDGVISGMAFEQSVRPYQATDPTLTRRTGVGATAIRVSNTAKFVAGAWIAVGEGTNFIEVRQVTAINGTTLTLNKPLANAHALGDWAGTEFVQYLWYPDVELDNIFFHDHVDGIHNWGHGLVGQFIIEPRGSTYHDPQTGAPVDSGTIVDIHTTNPLAKGIVDGSFREAVLMEIDENPITDSTINLRAEPWANRLLENADPSLLFSSYTHGDPHTPIPKAYPNDPIVIRTTNVGPSVDTMHVDGHHFYLEPRYLTAGGGEEGSPIDSIHYGISEKFSLMFNADRAGDYLYMNGINRRFRDGAWGILRVLPGLSDSLKPLPGVDTPAAGDPLPTKTGGRPPSGGAPGDPCPAGSGARTFAVTAVDVPTSGSQNGDVRSAFVPSSLAALVTGKLLQPEPLVLHADAGECITVHLTNGRALARVSFHTTKLLRGLQSSGINIGFNPEQTVAPGDTRDYRFYAPYASIGAALISDFGDSDAQRNRLYGAIVISPAGSSFTDPATGESKNVGTKIDVHTPSGNNYRDFTLLFSDADPRIGQDAMPYPIDVNGPALINYHSAQVLNDTAGAFGTAAGTPTTPMLKAYAGDAVRVHALVVPTSEQMHVFGLGGIPWPTDYSLTGAQMISAGGVGPWESMEAHITAGGEGQSTGDFFYGDMRRPFTQGGMWGIQRVYAPGDPSCPIQPLTGPGC